MRAVTGREAAVAVPRGVTAREVVLIEMIKDSHGTINAGDSDNILVGWRSRSLCGRMVGIEFISRRSGPPAGGIRNGRGMVAL
jgi:hypothetical protein